MIYDTVSQIMEEASALADVQMITRDDIATTTGPGWLMPVEEQIANARLIAAAPDLLALVRAYRNTYPLDVYADKAEAAIARAEAKP